MIRFEDHFRLFSYLAVFCGFLSLWVSGSFGIFETAGFVALIIAAWCLEHSRWQINERFGTLFIVLAIPVYYFLWRFRYFEFSNSEMMLPGILARLILSFTGIKLLQRKSDRDWMFLYVMAFFQVLLAAGLSISIGYLASFAAYIFVMACTIIMFEIRKAENVMKRRTPDVPDSERLGKSFGVRRVLSAAGALILLTAAFAVPTFFILPRVGGAGLIDGRRDSSSYAGFSDTVKLGGFGRIQQSDEVVMRVRVDGDPPAEMRWRGVALDTFDGQTWSKTKAATREPRTKNDRDLIQVDVARRQEGITIQTVYLEPLDTPVLFGLNRIVGIQGNFPLIFRDPHGSLSYQRSGERVSYKVLSDISVPNDAKLRGDHVAYSDDVNNYLQLPENLDPRIAELAAAVTTGADNRFDAARSVESYLQTKFGYTLEQKAGGKDPLADFLFNVREGHCEYFAAAMAVMLRMKGVATRVVNGFQRGDYNETADVFVVRQRNAHSWVEVYFPETETWAEFDPTPFAGQGSETAAGITTKIRKYMEALETFWIQYFVAFDNQEQRSLFVNMRRGVSNYQSIISTAWNELQGEIEDWWKQVRGDEGIIGSLSAIGFGMIAIFGFAVSIFAIRWLLRKAVKLKVWRLIRDRFFGRRRETVVEFYERMLKVLATKGYRRENHQTPLEFAFATGMPEAVNITRRYNCVRFGNRDLTFDDAQEIDAWLKAIATAIRNE